MIRSYEYNSLIEGVSEGQGTGWVKDRRKKGRLNRPFLQRFLSEGVLSGFGSLAFQGFFHDGVSNVLGCWTVVTELH